MTETNDYVWAYAQVISQKYPKNIPTSCMWDLAKNLKRKMQREGIPLPDSVFSLLNAHLQLIEKGLEPFVLPVEKKAAIA